MIIPDSAVSLVVDNNPQAFDEAYWVVDSVKVYTKDYDYDPLQAPFFAQGSEL